jgi:hypothetical protein
MKIGSTMTSWECYENKWLYMKYIGKMAEKESLLSTCCSSNFSVALGGLYDIKRHSETSLRKSDKEWLHENVMKINGFIWNI